MKKTEGGLHRRRSKNMEWVAQFESQMLVCGLLSKALYGAPDRDWLDMLVQKRVFRTTPFPHADVDFDEARQQLQAWSDGAQGKLDDEAFACLHDDYMRLFIGPGPLLAAPWESVYRNKDGAVFQRETISTKNWYLRFGLALATEYNEPADHIGLQFGFLAYLCERTIAASEISDGGEVKRLIHAQQGFMGQHVTPWVAKWADDAYAGARTDFYRGIALLARATVIEAGSFLSVGAP